MRRQSDERGIALVLAVFALVVIGALVAGTFYAGRIEERSGQGTVASSQAFAAAEYGLDSTISPWNRSTYNGMGTGYANRITVTTMNAGSRGRASVTVTKLNNQLFLVQSTGSQLNAANSVLTRRVLSRLVRLNLASMPIKGAVTSGGNITVGGSSTIDGYDQLPSGWAGTPANCDALTGGKAGIAVATGATISYNGVANTVTGTTATVVDASITDASFTNFVATTFADMAANADIRLTLSASPSPAPSVTGTSPTWTCNTGQTYPNNWGEPTVASPLSPCFTYFPVIYAPGNLSVNGGRGQGVLLVDGNLTISGQFMFTGPVIVNGSIRSTGTGGHITGALMVRDSANLDNSMVSGNTDLQYSSCAVARALSASANTAPLAQRSWSFDN